MNAYQRNWVYVYERRRVSDAYLRKLARRLHRHDNLTVADYAFLHDIVLSMWTDNEVTGSPYSRSEVKQLRRSNNVA